TVTYFAATLRYLLTASGMNTAISTTQLINAYSVGFCCGHASVGGNSWWLPNSDRTESDSALIGFHSANTCSGPGNRSAATNTVEMNVTGKIQMKPALCATSTLPEISAISEPTQAMANANSNSIRYASTASVTLPRMRQPMSKPHNDITRRPSVVTARSDSVRPSSTAELDMGSERNRSMMPFCRSLAIPMTVNAELNATVWTKMPPIRKSRYATGSSPMLPPKT